MVLGVRCNRHRNKAGACIDVFDRHGTDQATTFLTELAEIHDHSDATFLVDGYGHWTALFRIGLSAQLDYTERNLIEQ